MQRTQMSSDGTHGTGLDRRRAVAIVGIVLAGVVAALTLPFWMAAAMMLVALGAIRVVATAPVLDPVVIRRDQRR